MNNARICRLEQPLLLFLNVGETHVPYWHKGAPWDRDDNPCVPFQRPSRERQDHLP